MIGEKLREIRQGQQLSLTEVAGKAQMSAATLSRIENEKQALDVKTLFVLARVLRVAPEDLIGSNGNGRPGNGRRSEDDHELAGKIAAMSAGERTRLWRELAANRRTLRSRRKENKDIASRIEELLAQVDFLRQEIEAVKMRLRKR